MTKDFIPTNGSPAAEKPRRHNPPREWREWPNVMQTDMSSFSLRYLLPRRWWPPPRDRHLRR